MRHVRSFAVPELISLLFAINIIFPQLAASAQVFSQADHREELRDGVTYRGEVSTKPRSYLVLLKRNQYVELLITKGDLRITARVSRPEGGLIANFSGSGYGPLRVAFIANHDGAHEVVLQSLERNDFTGRYELGVRVKSLPTRHDRKAVVAAQAFAEADTLDHQREEEAAQKALQRYLTALNSWLAVGRLEEAIATLDRLAGLSLAQGQNQNALNYYRRAWLLSRQTGDRRLQMIELNNVGYVYGYLGQSSKTLAMATVALKYYARRNTPAEDTDIRAEAAARNSVGEAHYSLGNPKKSLEFFEAALALWTSVGDRRSKALAHLNLGYSYIDLGDLSQAHAHLTRALSLWREIAERRGEALTLTAFGDGGLFSRGETKGPRSSCRSQDHVARGR